MWSMPLGVRKVVAVIVALCAIGGFAMGFISVPAKSHLPGEGLPGSGAAPIDAMEATPLAPSEPLVVTRPAAADKKAADDKKDAPDPLDAVTDASKLTPQPEVSAVEKPAPRPGGKSSGPPEDKVGDLLDGITPPPGEDPPH